MKRTYSRKWVLATLAFGVAAVAATLRGGSIWPDEGITYSVVRLGFSDFVRSFVDFSAGSAQCGMLLYVWFEWIWAHIFGFSELALRASNVILMVPYMVYSAKCVKKLKLSPWYLGLFAFHSMFVFQINNARPYVLLASMGMAFFYYAMLCDLNDRRVLAKLHLFFLLGMLTHMMFLFAFVGYLARCVVLWRRKRLDVRGQFRALIAWMPAYVVLAAYYVYVYFNAEEVGNALANPLVCVLEILYFLGGFYGLAINRVELRYGWFNQLNARHMILLGLMVAAYAGMIAYMRKGSMRRRVDDDSDDSPTLWELFAIFAITLFAFIVGNIIAGTLFWDRHCIWIMPYMLVILCMLIDGMLRSRKRAFRALAVLMIAMQLISTGHELFDPHHAKDDYKGVVQWFDALQEDEEYTLLFMGDESVFEYYGWVGSNTDGTATQISEAIGTKVLINDVTYDGLQSGMEAYPGLYYLVLSRLNRFDLYNTYDYYEGDTRFQNFKVVRIDTRTGD